MVEAGKAMLLLLTCWQWLPLKLVVTGKPFPTLVLNVEARLSLPLFALPAFLIIQDEALLHIPGVTDGLLPGGKILVNSSKAAEELAAPDNTELITLPASLIAKQFLGRPVPNTALLAAFLSLTNLFPIDALVNVLAHKFSGSVLEHNTQLIHQAAEQVPQGHWQEAIHATGN